MSKDLPTKDGAEVRGVASQSAVRGGPPGVVAISALSSPRLLPLSYEATIGCWQAFGSLDEGISMEKHWVRERGGPRYLGTWYAH